MASEKKKKKIFCFGYGYTADFLAQDLLNDDEIEWVIAGTTRDKERLYELRERGIKAYLFEPERPLGDPAYILEGVTHILISTPPDQDGDPVFITHAEDILKLKSLEWVGYLSTTGVYGDRQGGWVDESAELRPTSQRGSRRVLAEDQWMSLFFDHQFPLHIFRLAGIYGPGRSALDTVRYGNARRIDKPGHAFNRVHVADIVRTLRASMKTPLAGEVYNVADDNPAASHEVIDYACQLLERPSLPVTPYSEADMAPMARSFYRDNKRVSNTKIKDELGIKLRYPDYKSGLKACFEESRKHKSFF